MFKMENFILHCSSFPRLHVLDAGLKDIDAEKAIIMLTKKLAHRCKDNASPELF
jgi:hypothetical protein